MARVTRGVVAVEAVAADGTRSGSGFFLERRGLVATALHTVEGARRVRVTVPGRFAASDARLLAVSSAWDLAVLEVAWPLDAPYHGLELDGTPLAPGTEIALTGFGRLGGAVPEAPLTLRGIVSGAPVRQGLPAYILDVAAREGFSGSPVYATAGGAVAGVLTRVHAQRGVGAGPGGAAPSAALESLLSLVRPAPAVSP